MNHRIDVTVAAVIEQQGRFLLVEELVNGRRVFNQPAGHLEAGESLVEAVIRETREETGYEFRPSGLLGVYLWEHPDKRRSYLRVAFSGPASAPTGEPRLDDGIIGVHWLSPQELFQREPQLRSPMVTRCVAAYRAGIGYPLDALIHLLPDCDLLAELA